MKSENYVTKTHFKLVVMGIFALSLLMLYISFGNVQAAEENFEETEILEQNTKIETKLETEPKTKTEFDDGTSGGSIMPDQINKETPKVDDTTTETPKTEDPKVDDTTTETPKVEDPKVDDTTTETPKTEDMVLDTEVVMPDVVQPNLIQPDENLNIENSLLFQTNGISSIAGWATATEFIWHDISDNHANFELLLPTNTYYPDAKNPYAPNGTGDDIGDGVVSNMSAMICLEYGCSITAPFEYTVVVHDPATGEYKYATQQFTHAYYMKEFPSVDSAHYLTLDGLPPGSMVYVIGIDITGRKSVDMGTWVDDQSWDTVKVGVHLSNMLDVNDDDISSDIEIVENTNNPEFLDGKGTNVMKFLKNTAIDVLPDDVYYQTDAETTFRDEFLKSVNMNSNENFYQGGYGDFSYLDMLLNNVNVFSFDDIEGTHIVGPIIAKDEAYYKRETPKSVNFSDKKLIFADYSRNTPSYVGNLTPRHSGGRNAAINYDFDNTYAKKHGTIFNPPYLYTSDNTWLMNAGNENWVQEFVVIKDPFASFMSPNNTGNTALKHGITEDYVDFDDYEQQIKDECDKLLEDGTKVTGQDANGDNVCGGSIENFPMKPREYNSKTDGSILHVNPGECWTIKDASLLENINIVLPDGSDYFSSSSPDPLTINFDCEDINPTVMDGKKVSQFPLITMNGVEFENPGPGETVEFNEFGNKLIFNMPKIVTTGDENRIVTKSTSQNIPGHILMPRAEFWNYHENLNGALVWEGGNINGMVLAQDVHLGETEVHMWAYGGKEAKFASYKPQATKTVNGHKPGVGEEFEFVIQKYIDDTTSPDDGIYTSGFPLKTMSNENGNIQFQNIVFTKAGTYKFIMKETKEFGSNSITFDETKYLLTITVTENVSSFTVDETIQKLDEDNNVIDKTYDEITFNNTNSASSVLPSTGGSGTHIYIFAGLALMLVSLYLKSNKKCRL